MKVDIETGKWITTILVLLVLAFVIKKYIIADSTTQGVTTLS